MRLVVWLLRGFVFFTLFAFALNNQQPVTVHWFFGAEWRTPLVIVVLVAFAAGSAVGVLAMVPGWWRQRRAAQRLPAGSAPATSSVPAATVTRPAPAVSGFGGEQPPREGL